MELINETNIESAYKIFIGNQYKKHDVFYICPKTKHIFKESYLQFKEFIHNKRLIGFIDLIEKKLIIIENVRKTNSDLKYLIIRYINCDSEMLGNVEKVITKMFYKKGIEKIKIICNKEELKNSIEILNRHNYFLDIEYIVGEDLRVQYSKYLYEND